MEWESKTEILGDGRVHKVTFSAGGKDLTYENVLSLWHDDKSFRDRFISVLRAAPFDAYFWETPPVTRDTAGRGFEFVLVNGPELGRMAPDPDAFGMHFPADPGPADVAAFWNLGRDAMLIAPGRSGVGEVYPHLGAFTRTAPPAHQHALWRLVGEKVIERLGDKPIWVSTSGLGIAWLHVRLDSYPKYYTYLPYRTSA